MNFQDLKEKILTDIKYQLGIGFVIMLIAIYVFFKFFLFPSPPKPSTPCYNTDLIIWLPEFLDEKKFLQLISKYALQYCLKMEIINNNSNEMEKDFILALAENNSPDIILARNDFVFKNKKFLFNLENESKKFNYYFSDENLDYGYPIFIDTLVFYFNKRIFDFFKIEPPKTLDELISYLQKFNQESYENFYPVGLGSSLVKNKKEIILVLKGVIRKPIDQTINFYYDLNKENKVFPKGLINDLNLFANEKLGAFFGFYRDKKEFLNINPRINYGIIPSPLETFPPSAKNYVEVYYFVIPEKSKKKKIANEFLNWFLNNSYQKFIEIYDLIPNLKSAKVEEEKKIFLDSVKYGSSYLDIISQDNYKKFDRILEIWEENYEEGKRELIRSGLNFER